MLTATSTQEVLKNIIKMYYVVKKRYNKCFLLEFQLFSVYSYLAKFYEMISHLWNLENVCHQMPEHETRNTFYWTTWEVNAVADLLAVVSDRTFWAFNKSGTTRAIARDIFKAFVRVWHADLLHKLN